MSGKLLTEHHLEFLSLKGGCTRSSEFTFVKMPHCCKSHAVAHLIRVRKMILLIMLLEGEAYTGQPRYVKLAYLEYTAYGEVIIHSRAFP